MILPALKQKLRERGPLGIAADAAELAMACAVIGLETLAIAGAAATVAVAAVVSSPALALELLTRQRHPKCLVEGLRCDFLGRGDDGLDRCVGACWYSTLGLDKRGETSCRNAEEPGS